MHRLAGLTSFWKARKEEPITTRIPQPVRAAKLLSENLHLTWEIEKRVRCVALSKQSTKSVEWTERLTIEQYVMH